MSDIVLYHATDSKRLQSILDEGLHKKTYFAGDDDLCDYYVGTVRDDGAKPVVLAVDLDDLDRAFLTPDFPGIEEPITGAIGLDEDEVEELWEASDQGWEDSLEIVKSVRYDAVIPASLIRVVDDLGEHHRLDEYVAALAVSKAARPG